MAKKIGDKTKVELEKIINDAVAKALKLMGTGISPTNPVEYHCTGWSFRCTELYTCNDSDHSCRGTQDEGFECTNLFNCTGGPFTRVVDQI